MKKKSSAKGFTLIELLVVVLIIGILAAVALPGYRKSVEKSRVSDALTAMSAISKSEHGWYLNNNSYTKDFANLDIDISGTMNNGALVTDLYTYELIDTGIIADRNNGEYTLYKDYENQQILCTPGTHYICEDLGAFTKAPCEKVGMAWAETNSTCYVDEEARCKGLYDDSMWKTSNGGVCGYIGTSGQEINEGMVCLATRGYTCQNSIVNYGGICDGVSCSGSTINNGGKCIGRDGTSCSGVTVNNGGVCIGSCNEATINDGGICKNGCWRITVNSGGKCIYTGSGSCSDAHYYGTGCLEGADTQSGGAPKCECPIDPATGKHLTSC